MSQLPALHIITRLIIGGAQENTLLTADLFDPTRYAVDVISGPQTDLEVNLIKRDLCAWVSLDILPYTQPQLRAGGISRRVRWRTRPPRRRICIDENKTNKVGGMRPANMTGGRLLRLNHPGTASFAPLSMLLPGLYFRHRMKAFHTDQQKQSRRDTDVKSIR